jgi:solute carrier family 13 (sodium-dependent dicarboxylate transporter), member 2/3/5
LIQRNTLRSVPADPASSGRTATTVAEPRAASLAKRDSDQSWIRANWGLPLATAVLAAILMLPTPADLPVVAHRMLAILGFAVIVWMTEAVDYAVSA